MDGTHSNAYRVWQQIGGPAHPTAEQIQQIEKAAALAQSVPDHSILIQAGKVNLDIAIPRQGVVLVRLENR
jgi:xylan 1,4-beta-xylosidase